MERHAESDFHDRDSQQSHDKQKDEQRRNFGDHDFGRGCRGHQQLLDGAGLTLPDHRSRCDKRAIEDEQQSKYARHNKPGVLKSGVV